MKELINQLRKFRDDRDWKQYHTPENLAKSISIESGELLECFQWEKDFKLDKVKDELADVFLYCLLMADSLGVDLTEIAEQKLKKNGEKYPVEKARGNSRKYDEL
jgi:Predicted pyrophosphatase